ncbi:putative membrane protein YqhA [Methanolinea mesophila]|uniref:YqhA family protein n=1 Tax=Methanolinea mesophila TaxID=547055 RepID=UPI001AE185C6|nr:YqhA family protein [Methanolinea mesophila]MBP1928731.1 putative membrane protein YqhA [Methanolinea mesophila]
MNEKPEACEPADSGDRTIRVISDSSRWLFFLAVIGTALIAIFLFILGFLVTISTIVSTVSEMTLDINMIKEILAVFIEIIDLFLVATVFYIIALGLYELFIAKAPLPGWLKICDLDDLKDKLLGLVIIALAVLILGETLTWNGTGDILAFGLAIAAGIAAISVYIWVRR